MGERPRDPDQVWPRCDHAIQATGPVAVGTKGARKGDGMAKPTVDGRRWREALARAGITQSALAARVGVSREVLSRYVTGTNRMPAEILMACARELGVSAESLWRG